MFDTIAIHAFSIGFIAETATFLPFVLLWIFWGTSVGLAFCASISETAYYFNHNSIWKAYTLYWQQLLKLSLKASALAFVLFVVVSTLNWLPLWQKLSVSVLLLVVVLEVFLIGITTCTALLSLKRWDMLKEKSHLVCTWMTGFLLGLTAWLPIAFTAWLECPLGISVRMDTLNFDVTNILWFLFSPLAVLKFTHAILSGIVMGAGASLSLCCYQLVKNVSATGRQQLMIAMSTTALALFLTMCIGDSTGYLVARQQPLKMALIQQIPQGGNAMPFEVVGPLRIPNMLSRLSTHREHGFVPGFDNITEGGYNLPEGGKAISLKKKNEYARLALQISRKNNPKLSDKFDKYSSFIGYAFMDKDSQLISDSTLYYWSFRIMVGLGLLLFVVLGGLVFFLLDGNLPERKKWLKGGLLFYSLTIVCSLCGWVVSEGGKTPWAICDFLSVKSAVSSFSSLWMNVELGVVCLLCVAGVYFMYKKSKAIIS